MYFPISFLLQSPLSILVPFLIIVYSLYKGIAFKINITAICAFCYLYLNAVFFQGISILSPQFYRYDGSILVFIGFLCFVPSISTKRPITLLMFLAILPTYFLYLLKAESQAHFTLFYEAHNAAGGYIALVGFAHLWYLRFKVAISSPTFITTSLVILVLLLATDSRQAIVSFLVSALLICFTTLTVTQYFFLLTVISMIISSAYLNSWISNGRYIPLHGEEFAVYTDNFLPFSTGRDITIAMRILYYWPRALDFFLSSPVFGIGLGRFNDGYITEGFYGVLSSVSTNVISLTADHAHNSYLMFASETGIVGLFLIIATLVSSLKFVHSSKKALFRGLLMLLMSLSFFEHRLPSPSVFVPFLVIYYCYRQPLLPRQQSLGQTSFS